MIFFLYFAQNIDCGYTLEPPRRGGSNEYPQSMFWSKNKKNRYTPAYPSFAILKWGLRGYSLHGHVFLMLFYWLLTVHIATNRQVFVHLHGSCVKKKCACTNMTIRNENVMMHAFS